MIVIVNFGKVFHNLFGTLGKQREKSYAPELNNIVFPINMLIFELKNGVNILAPLSENPV